MGSYYVQDEYVLCVYYYCVACMYSMCVHVGILGSQKERKSVWCGDSDRLNSAHTTGTP